MNIIEKIQNDLLTLSDTEYKSFHSKLIPTVDSDTVIGVRVPIIRDYANELFKAGEYAEFLNTLPHNYFDEYQLHSFIICKIRNFDLCISEVEKLLPYIDNWAVCDSLRPVCFSKNKDKLIIRIYEWLKSDKPYTVRFAVGMLMTHFLDTDFKDEYFDLVLSINSEEYYVNMMIAWYFATALCKQYDKAINIIAENKLPVWVHNKTIQKAIESYRITEDKKKYFKSFKIKI